MKTINAENDGKEEVLTPEDIATPAELEQLRREELEAMAELDARLEKESRSEFHNFLVRRFVTCVIVGGSLLYLAIALALYIGQLTGWW